MLQLSNNLPRLLYVKFINKKLNICVLPRTRPFAGTVSSRLARTSKGQDSWLPIIITSCLFKEALLLSNNKCKTASTVFPRLPIEFSLRNPGVNVPSRASCCFRRKPRSLRRLTLPWPGFLAFIRTFRAQTKFRIWKSTFKALDLTFGKQAKSNSTWMSSSAVQIVTRKQLSSLSKQLTFK